MKSNCLMTVLTIIIVALSVSFALASSTLIKDKKILQCYPDTCQGHGIEEYVLKKADSLKFAETGERFTYHPSTLSRFVFTKMPSIGLYSIGGGAFITNDLKLNYEYLLFNHDDSTMYHFGGNASQFSKVIRGYLSTNFNPAYVMELLYLFVNTTNESKYYFLVENAQDFINLLSRERSMELSDIDEREIELISNYAKPICINQNNGTFEIGFYTWHDDLGYPSLVLDYWKFKVTKEEIVLLERAKQKPDFSK